MRKGCVAICLLTLCLGFNAIAQDGGGEFLEESSPLPAAGAQDQGPRHDQGRDRQDQQRQRRPAPQRELRLPPIGYTFGTSTVTASRATAGGSYLRGGVSVLPWPFLAVEAEAMADLAPLAFSDAILGADLCFRLGKALELSSNRIFIPLSLRYAYGFRDNGHSIGLGLAVMDLQDSFGTGNQGMRALFFPVEAMYSLSKPGFWWSYSLVRIWVYF